VLIALAAGCSRPADQETVPEDEPEAGARPAVRHDTMYVEGMAEAVTLRRFDDPVVPFTTYLPPGLEAQAAGSPEGLGVVMETASGPGDAPGAYLHFFFPSQEQQDVSLEALRESITGTGGLLQRNGWQLTQHFTSPQAASPCSWAHDVFRFSDPGHVPAATGYVCTGAHQDAPFYLIVYTPPEYGDGFGPRVDVVLSALRWRDGGTALGAP
jgi:hypothetical protein